MKNKNKLITLILIFCNVILLASFASAFDIPIGVQKLIAYQNEVALSITFLIALLGGMLTFLSPCGFAIIPTFFSYVFKERKRALFMTSVFVVGMTTAFTIFGLIAGIIGNFFNVYKDFFAQISGVALFLFGIMMIFNKGFSFLDFRIKHHPNHSWSSFWLGFLFASGWSPCVGPILGSIVVLAAGIGSITKSALLFATYSLGVAVPLMIFSYFSDKYDLANIFISRHVKFNLFGKIVHTHLYGIISGTMLSVLGIIIFIGNGTTFFMNTIPAYLPWTMNFFSRMNALLVSSHFFTGKIADVFGIIIICALILILFRVLSKTIINRKDNK